MRPIGIVCLIIFLASTLASGQKSNHIDKLKKLYEKKREYIKDALALTPEESIAFWPIYDAYHKVRYSKIRAHRKKYRTQPDATDEDAKVTLTAYISDKEEEMMMHIQYLKNLKEVIQAKKVLTLERTERRFDREVVKNLKSRKKKYKNSPKGK